MKRDYRASAAVLAMLAALFILLVGWCAFGWAGVITVAVFSGLVALAVRSTIRPRRTDTWYWDRTDHLPPCDSDALRHYHHRAPASRRPRRNTRGGAR